MKGLKLRSVIFAALSVTTLTLLGISIPFLSPLMVVLWPVPVIVISVMQGGKAGVVATLLAGFLNAIILHPLVGLVTLFGFGLIGVVMGNAWAEGFSQKIVLGSGIIAGIFSEMLMLILSYSVFHLNPVEHLTKEVHSVLMARKDLISPEQLQFLMGNLKILQNLYLGITFCTVIIVVLGSYFFSVWVLKRSGREVKKAVDFSLLRFHPVLSIILIAGFFMPDNFILENLLVIVSFGLVIQGLSLFYFFLKRTNFSRFLWVIIILLFFFLPLISIGFVILGMVDQAFNFRKRMS